MAGVVGLEMDTGVIRAMELVGTASQARLAKVGQVEMPDGAVVEGSIAEVGMVTEALKRLWAQARFGSRDVVLGVFSQGVIARLITFPKLPKDKLEQAIRLQSAEYFPIPISQLTMDFAVLGEKQGSTNGSELEVLLVGARTATLNKCVAALQASRLVPKVIDASPLALLRALPKDKLAGTVAVVDVSNGVGSLVMVVDGVPRFARVIPVSLEQYAEELGLSWKEVLPALSAAAGDGDGEPALFDSMAALDEWGLKAVEEIRSSITFFIKADNRPGIDSVLLSGSGARLTGLSNLLGAQLDLPVEVVKPLARIAGSRQQHIDQEAALPDFAVSAGLALRGLEV